MISEARSATDSAWPSSGDERDAERAGEVAVASAPSPRPAWAPNSAAIHRP